MNKFSRLGLVANSYRRIGTGAEYEKYFDLSQCEGKEIEISDGDVYDTLDQMSAIVSQTLDQTKKISKKLKGSTREQTCKNIWNFLYNNYQYKKDVATREQLRTPIRAWRDRANGIDCDCYAITISSILTNLNIPHAFRMAAYGGDFQHVYVIVPAGNINGPMKNRDSYIVIDPVLDSFDKEQPFKQKHDNKMKTVLNGTDSASDCRPPVNVFTLRRFVQTEQVFQWGLIPTREFLRANNIAFEEAIDQDTNAGVFIVNTPCGSQAIPPILTKAQAELIKAQVTSAPQILINPAPTTTTTAIAPGEPTPGEARKKFPWLWVLLGAGALIVFSGGKKEKNRPALQGVKQAKKIKRKPLKVVHI